MDRVEYLIKHMDLLEAQRAQYTLNQYGKDGWTIDYIAPLSVERPTTVAVVMMRVVIGS